MKHPYAIIHRCLTVVLVGIMALSAGSCADDNLAENPVQGDRGVAVRFNVSSAQEELLYPRQQSMAMPATRAAVVDRLATQGLTLEDLATRKLEATNNAGLDACLIETTVEGVNPVLPSPNTRANIKGSIDANFSSLGYRSNVTGFVPGTPNWFYNALTTQSGALVSPLQWSWSLRYGRFYGVYPEAKSENKIALSPRTYSGTPYVDFEVEEDITKQKDLMAACSGEVYYATRGTAPESNLKFRHALTAIKFAVGQNLSWNKRIVKVEIKNAYSKGRYTLPTEKDGTGAAINGQWSQQSTPKDFMLTPATPVSTADNPNTILTGNGTDNYTFFMIPQLLNNRGSAPDVTVVITLQSTHAGSTSPNTITIPLKGTWKPGTTKTYKLSQNTSDWTYTFTIENPAAAAYDATETGNYKITSFRQAPDGTQKAVPWKIIGYEESADNGATWTDLGMTKPAWLTALTLENGGGGTAAEAGMGTLKTDIIDMTEPYNRVLKEAPEKGSPGNYYNLSNQTNGGPTIENTANCYLISAPGYYCLPLVYGNAVKNSAPNPRSYTRSASAPSIYGEGFWWNNVDLVHKKLFDHNRMPINSPYINVQYATDRAKTASIVWTDQSGIVEDLSVDWDEHGDGSNSFLRFHVPANRIRNGNATIAVKNESGVIMWSWHLWFDHKEALNTITCTNYQGVEYKFTTRNLGFVDKKEETTYHQPRKVRIRVEPTSRQPGSAPTYIILTQNNGKISQGNGTLYNWGRKDPFFGIIAHWTTVTNENYNTIEYYIQHPNTLQAGYIHSRTCEFLGKNLWSIDFYTTNRLDMTKGSDDPVVKTIYDPCPVGFHVPASNAFTGFTKTGKASTSAGEINGSGNTLMGGVNFNNKINNPDATIFFPFTSSIEEYGHKATFNRYNYTPFINAYYWTQEILRFNGTGGSVLFFDGNNSMVVDVTPISYYGAIGNCHAIRPVADN